MIYNKGDTPIPLPDENLYGQTHLKDGRTVQYVKNGPHALNPQRVAAWAKSNKLNELLQNSTVNKDKAVDLAVAGVGEPAVVTTRRPDGTEVKAGATTTAVAPDDVALHEATKRDGDTVQVETPEQNMGDQAAKVQAEIAARKAEMDAAERGVFTGEIKPEEMFTPESKPEPVAAAPVDPLAGATKLSENKFGVSVHKLPEGGWPRPLPQGQGRCGHYDQRGHRQDFNRREDVRARDFHCRGDPAAGGEESACAEAHGYCAQDEGEKEAAASAGGS